MFINNAGASNCRAANSACTPQVYANPASEFIPIKNANAATRVILELKGSVVRNAVLVPENEVISIKELQPRVYIISLKAEKGVNYKHKLTKLKGRVRVIAIS